MWTVEAGYGLGEDVVNREVDVATTDDVLSADEAARLLKVHPKTVRSLARRGELPGRKVGRAWRFERATVLSHLSDPPADDVL